MAKSAERSNGNHKLGSVLWSCANTLRGSAVDRTDWKAYILPLLFLKRISDVWDEETAEAQALFGEASNCQPPGLPNLRMGSPDGVRAEKRAYIIDLYRYSDLSKCWN